MPVCFPSEDTKPDLTLTITLDKSLSSRRVIQGLTQLIQGRGKPSSVAGRQRAGIYRLRDGTMVCRSGFTDAIKAVFAQTITQLCIVHQIRNSCKYVVWKDRKAFCADLKEVYGAPTREAAEQALENFDVQWGLKYKHAIQSWRTNWSELTSYFDFPVEIRRIIYTTNTIENVNRGIRKYTKTKVQFPDDMSAQKAVYMSIMNIEKKWSMPIHTWGYILHQFLTIFENRCRL